MSNIDCERFVRGAEEIDRKRRVITRVLTSVEALLKQIPMRGRGWKFGQTVLEIPLGELTYVLGYYKRTLCGELRDQEGKNQLWWGTVNYADAIPAYVVPIVYAHLPKIVEQTDEAFPEAGIRTHFEFFSK